MAHREYNKLFVGGDLSGIQKFLYNITSRYASVSLKGRSAFLSNYLREVCNSIEDSIESHGGTIDELYCSGGKFYLITENTSAITKAIDGNVTLTKEKLWEEHKGQLNLNVSHIAFAEENDNFYVSGYENEQNTSSGVLWKYVNADFARQKNQKFKDLLISHPNKFFSFNKNDEDAKELFVGKRHKVCALTGVEFDISKQKSGAKFFINDGNGLYYLPSAIKQIEEGKKLSKEEGLKTFEEYAGGSYLGILRMDVDGMGKRFIVGFKTIEDYRAFSEKARTFFEEDIKHKLLPQKIENGPDKGMAYKDYLCIIYAGGDDLFIVGRWDKVIDFAKLIHDKTTEEFKNEAYVDPFETNEQKRKKYISISGGIAIVKPKFPIAKAAEIAGEAEDAAKQGEKNAFNMFGRTISWDSNKPFMNEKYEHEYAYVEKFKDLFVEYISKYSKDYGFSKSILHKIMLYSEIADMNVEREAMGKPMNYSYMWHISYYMTRFMEKYKNHEDDIIKKTLYNFCLKLRDEHLPKNLGLIALASRWAELVIKDNENNF